MQILTVSKKAKNIGFYLMLTYQIIGAEEENLRSNCHGNILTSGHINVFLGLLCDHHFSLE